MHLWVVISQINRWIHMQWYYLCLSSGAVDNFPSVSCFQVLSTSSCSSFACSAHCSLSSTLSFKNISLATWSRCFAICTWGTSHFYLTTASISARTVLRHMLTVDLSCGRWAEVPISLLNKMRYRSWAPDSFGSRSWANIWFAEVGMWGLWH